LSRAADVMPSTRTPLRMPSKPAISPACVPLLPVGMHARSILTPSPPPAADLQAQPT